MNKYLSDVQEREERLHGLIADYLDLEAAGRAPQPSAWLAEHAEFREELRQFLEEHQRLARMGAPLRALADAPARSDAATLAGTDTTEIAAAAVRSFGDYELLHEIARGGMGVVYKARQKSLDRIVALKMILAGQLATKAEVERFRLEAHAAANLDHPQIVPIYEVGERDGQHYFSMKFIEGANLAQAMAQRRCPATGRDGQRRAAALLAAAARAVHYAHQRGVIHRDLKPANILLAPRDSSAGAEAVPLLTDFGLAKRVGSDAALTHTGAVVGTPSYMAPEQAAGGKQITIVVDVYALGAILYELLTGQPPFRGDNPLEVLRQVTDREPVPPRSLVSEIERDLETICLKCLEKSPERRYRSAEALADDLERWLAGEPIEARPAAAWERTVKWARRRPAVASLVAVTLASAAALLIGGLYFNAALQVALGQVGTQQHDLARAEEALGAQQKEAKETNGRAQELLARANGLRLVAQSEVVRPTEPALALLLGLEAARLGPRRAEHNNALVKALAECREVGPLLQREDGFVAKLVRWLDGGRQALTVSHQTVRLWDTQSGRLLAEQDGPQLQIGAFALSPDEKRFALTFEDSFDVRAVQIDGRLERKPFLVTDQVARVYDVQTATELHVLRGHQHRVSSVEFSPDGKQIVTASLDGTARLWDGHSGKELRVLEGHECGLSWAGFAPQGRILTASAGGQPLGKRINPLQQLRDRYPADAVDPPLPKRLGSRSGGGSTSPGGGGNAGESLFACFWDADTGARLQEFRNADRSPLEFRAAARLDPTDRRLVAMSFNGAAVYDAQTGKELHFLKHLNDPPRPPVFSGDGKRVLLFFRVAIKVFDLAKGQELATLHAETDDFRSARFSPDPEGRYVVTTSEDRTARLWDAATGTELFALRGHEQGVIDAEFSPDGRRLLTGSDDRTARIWNIEPEQSYERNLDPKSRNWWFGPRARKPIDPSNRRRAIWSASWSPDGKQIAAGTFDSTLRLWDPAGKLLAERQGYAKLEGPVSRDHILREILLVSYCPDGKRVLTVSADRVAKVLDAKTGLAVPDQPPFQPVRIHDAMTGEELVALEGLTAGIRFARFSPDGTRLLVIPETHYSTPTATLDAKGRPRTSGSLNAHDNAARLFDARTGKQLRAFEGSWKEIHNGCWDATGQRVCIVAGGVNWPDGGKMQYDLAARVWDVESGRLLHTLGGDDRWDCNDAAFSRDGRRLLTWFDTRLLKNSSTTAVREARVWDLESGTVLFRMTGTSKGVNFAAYSPDGRSIVTAGFDANSSIPGGGLGWHSRMRDTFFRDRTARLWDAETGALKHVLYGHERAVHEAEFSKNGRWLVTASEDRTARVWDVASGKEFLTLRGHEDAVKTASFNPDASLVLTVSWDGTARLWPVDPLPIAERHRPRALTDEERERYEVPERP